TNGRAATAVAAALDYALIPALLYVLTYNRSLAGELDPFHEGEHLAPLNDLLRGRIPFRDIYLQHGLIENAYLPLLASAWHGATLESVRWLRGLVQPLGYVCLYVLGRQVFASRLAAIITVLVMFLHVSWFGARQAFGLLSIAMVLSALTQGRGATLKL